MAFLLEVIIRSAFMFIFILIIMRFLGRRAIHQFTSFDLLFIIALGSAIGDQMICPDIVILWSVFVITSIMIFYRIQNVLANRYPLYEDLTEGSPVKIITDGIFDSREFKKHTPKQDDLLLLLRSKGVQGLGEVEAAYLERDGIQACSGSGSGSKNRVCPQSPKTWSRNGNLTKQARRLKIQVFTPAIKQVRLPSWKKAISFRTVEEIQGYYPKKHETCFKYFL